MEMDYQKKDIAKAPKVKAPVVPKMELPEEYELYQKRGLWHLVSENVHEIFVSKEEAHKWLMK